MSSASGISGGGTPQSFQSGGIQMGSQMGEGGGSNFYMGDGGGDGDRQEEDQGNPNIIVNQGEIDNRNQKRQYLESLITGTPDAWLSNLEKIDEVTNAWFNPWDINKTKSTNVVNQDKKKGKTKSPSKIFFVNA